MIRKVVEPAGERGFRIGEQLSGCFASGAKDGDVILYSDKGSLMAHKVIGCR